PPSPIAYYQQVGRAGRAVDNADVLLLPGAEDAAISRYFAPLAFPPEEQVRAVPGALSEVHRPPPPPAREAPGELPRSPVALDAARAHLGRVGVEVAPRKQWPTGLPAIGVALSGRIPADEQPLPGRALGRLSDLGWGARLRGLVDGPVPDEVFGGVVRALAD